MTSATPDHTPPSLAKPMLSARSELAKLICGALNHCLDAEPLGLEKLKPHQGKRLQLLNETLRDMRLVITAEGKLASDESNSDQAPELSLTLDLSRAIQLAVQGQEASGAVKIAGDAEFASALGWLAANLRWEFEADLARYLGEPVAHRIGLAVRSMGEALKGVAKDTEAMLKRGFEENAAPLVSQTQFERFNAQARELRDAVARLEKRVDLLERSVMVDANNGISSAE